MGPCRHCSTDCGVKNECKLPKNWEARIRICVPSPTCVSVYGHPCSQFCFFFPPPLWTSACKLLYNRWQSQQLPRKHTCSSEIELPPSSFFSPMPSKMYFAGKTFSPKNTIFCLLWDPAKDWRPYTDCKHEYMRAWKGAATVYLTEAKRKVVRVLMNSIFLFHIHEGQRM